MDVPAASVTLSKLVASSLAVPSEALATLDGLRLAAGSSSAGTQATLHRFV
jgi:hypothetical protein